ncbi:MAG: hypothetical protein HY906_03585 [Deltaproteobacteria bacterium]|nr:hypothetical protein [Deltaproteobacteria bacterium]
MRALVTCVLFCVLGAGCGSAAPALRWNVRFATAGGRGMLVLHTRDIKVAERVTLKFCSQERTELLTEAETTTREQPSWRAVFPLTPALEACLAHERKLEVTLETTRPGQAATQSLPLDDWSAERIYERVHVRELGELERATAGVKEQDSEKYLAALEDWIRRHPRSPAVEQARKEVARVRAELENERKEAEEKAKAEAARRRAEEDRRVKVQRGLADATAALQVGDHAKAVAALDRVEGLARGDAEQDAARRLRGQLQRVRRLADLRAKYAPRLVPKPRKLYAQKRIVLRELPDPKATGTLELEEGDEVWALAGAARAMVGVARASRTDLATLLAAGPTLDHVEGWVEGALLTPKDRWTAARRARQDEERTLFQGRPESDRADLRRLAAAGKVVSPKVQLGLLRKGYEPAETRRLALLLDVVIRAAENADDPRMPAICAGLAEVVKARTLADCAAAARLGASDESVAAIARDFGANSAGFASTFGIAKESVAKVIMAIAVAP